MAAWPVNSPTRAGLEMVILHVLKAESGQGYSPTLKTHASSHYVGSVTWDQHSNTCIGAAFRFHPWCTMSEVF